MFEGLGSRTYRYRYLIVAAWIVAAVFAVKLAPSLASQGATDQASFLPSFAPSVLARDAVEQAFPGATSPSAATISFSRDAGLTEADRAYLAAYAAWVTSADAPAAVRTAVTKVDSVDSRPELASMLKSDDGALELVNVNLNVGSAGGAADVIVSALRDHAATSAPTGLVVHVTGTAGISTDYLRAIKSGTDSTTTVTIVLVLVILLLIYRAPLAALVPLVTIGGAFVVARGVLGVLAAAGWHISSLLDTFLVVLVFGVGTDYAIFLISRFREEVSAEGDWHDASRTTVRRIGAVISASAATVMVGLGAMAFGDFEMIKSTGPALAVAILVTLIAGLTLAPALLAISGHYLFWPRHQRLARTGGPDGFFARLAAAVSRHPGLVAVALLVALLIPAGFVPQMKTNFDTLAELPATSDARAGYDVVAAHLGKGKLVQSTGLINAGTSGDMLAPASLARLRDTMAALAGTPGVSTVTSLVTPKGDGVVPDGFRPSIQLVTIGDAFKDDGTATASASSSSSSSLLDPKLSDGLASAMDYVGALGAAYPDVAGRSAFRTATRAITDAQDLVARVRKQSVVATQLRTLSSALISPASATAGGGSGSASGSGLIADYLAELAIAFPDIRALPAFAEASAAAETLRTQATAGVAVDAANGLNALAVHFDPLPDATLSPKSLAGTASALEVKREAKAAFASLPTALHGLADVFAARSDDIFVPAGLAGDGAAKVTDAVNAFVSVDRTATRFYVTTTDDPYNQAAFVTVRSAQATLDAAAPGFGAGASASLGGTTAQFSDVQTVLASDFTRVGIITVLGILVVLVILLRAVVAPLYLVGTVLVSYGSAVGLSAWLFQGPLGQAGVSFYLPLMVFVLLVALGSDYNIFLMSRVREESETRPIRDGIRIASGHTGAVITSAGLILAGTFGSMASAPLVVLFQVGVAVAIGVLIDTFVVRSILVPAITTLVGDRAWWPSGIRFGGRVAVPAFGGREAVLADAGAAIAAGVAVGVAAGPAGLAEAEPGGDARERRSVGRLAVALVLAALVPVTFAGLLTWSQRGPGGAAIAHAAVVDADGGATVTAGDGSTVTLALGKELAAGLVADTPGDAVTWEAADAPTAADGLANGRYGAVLTIPAGFSRAIAAIRADASGSQPAATLHLETASSAGSTSAEVAREVSAVIAASATRTAMASYVEDVLLAVSTSGSGVATAAGDARAIADRTTALASDASGISTVAGELVTGLDTLASGTSTALDGASKLAAGTASLASGARTLASGATKLATGAAAASTGAKKLAAGAASLSSGLIALDASTSGLPAQASALASGASDVAAGASSTADGAASLSKGLAQLHARTAGLGAQVDALNAGASSLLAGATSLNAGAGQAAAAGADLASGAGQLETSVDGYTAQVASLAAACPGLGGAPEVCAALAGIAANNGSLTAAAHGISTGASQLAGATSGLATGAAGVKTGAAGVHTGTAALAAAAPALEAGVAESAAGAAGLAAGTQPLATGASTLAAGTKQLAAGMTSLAGGVAKLRTGGAGVASGASSLAGGISDVASGASVLAAGAGRTASGATALADGTATSASGASKLSDAVSQAADGARIVSAEAGRLADDGGTIAKDVSGVATTLDTTGASAPGGTADIRAKVAARVADPVTVEATGAAINAANGLDGGLAALLMAVALWLGALGAFLVLPARRAAGGRGWWAGPAAGFAAAAGLGVVAAVLMIAALRLGVGLEVGHLPGLVAVCMLAALAFAAVVQALVVAFGTRGWVAALLLAAVQTAAAGFPYPADALPGPLAFLHPLLPLSWAADAMRTTVDGGSASIAPALVVLAAWLVGALLVTLAVTAGWARREEAPVAAG